jgi:aromatic ring-opening dioxygenase catalytic subunit (LigB family)
MNRHPILFVSHGAPDVLLKPGATVRLWQDLGAGCPARGRSWSSRPTGPRGSPP